MADSNRKPITDRLAALLAGPLLLGQRALESLSLPERDQPAETPPKAAALRITITPPEHAIKRRG